MTVLDLGVMCSYFAVDLLHVHDLKNYRAEYQTYTYIQAGLYMCI